MTFQESVMIMARDKSWFKPAPSLFRILEELCADTVDKRAAIERVRKLFPDETRKW